MPYFPVIVIYRNDQTPNIRAVPDKRVVKKATERILIWNLTESSTGARFSGSGPGEPAGIVFGSDWPFGAPTRSNDTEYTLTYNNEGVPSGSFKYTINIMDGTTLKSLDPEIENDPPGGPP